MATDPSQMPAGAQVFAVTDQNRIPEPSDPTGMSDVWRIDYQTAKGTRSWVTIPQRAYSAKAVAELILAQVGEEQAVDNMSA